MCKKSIPNFDITRSNVEQFPFYLTHNAGCRLFMQYFADNRASIDEKHGRRYFTGNAEKDKHPVFLWHDADVEVLGETTVKFTVYESAGSFSQQRGDIILERQVDFPATVLAGFIHQHQLQIATKVFDAREAEAARLKRIQDIEAVRQELFGVVSEATFA